MASLWRRQNGAAVERRAKWPLLDDELFLKRTDLMASRKCSFFYFINNAQNLATLVIDVNSDFFPPAFLF